MHNTSTLPVFPPPPPPYNTSRMETYLLRNPIENCRVRELVCNAHTALLRRTTFFYMESISAGTVFILPTACSSEAVPPASDFLRSSFLLSYIIRGAYSAVILATTDAWLNIVLARRHASVPALTPIFHPTRANPAVETSSTRKGRNEKVKARTQFSPGNVAICFHPASHLHLVFRKT